MSDRTAQLLDFLLLANQAKSIERATTIGIDQRQENVAEHAWHAALTAILTHRDLDFAVDLGRVLELIVVHDLVEILAGDAPAYDPAAQQGQEEREQAAADKLFGEMLPPDIGPHLRAAWDEFEAAETPEARFAKACDRTQGFMQNLASDGKPWRDKQVPREWTLKRTAHPRATSANLRALIELMYRRADDGDMWPDIPVA